jgi:hypothetical protein
VSSVSPGPAHTALALSPVSTSAAASRTWRPSSRHSRAPSQVEDADHVRQTLRVTDRDESLTATDSAGAGKGLEGGKGQLCVLIRAGYGSRRREPAGSDANMRS